jgi:hypothetical protein
MRQTNVATSMSELTSDEETTMSSRSKFVSAMCVFAVVAGIVAAENARGVIKVRDHLRWMDLEAVYN